MRVSITASLVLTPALSEGEEKNNTHFNVAVGSVTVCSTTHRPTGTFGVEVTM